MAGIPEISLKESRVLTDVQMFADSVYILGSSNDHIWRINPHVRWLKQPLCLFGCNKLLGGYGSNLGYPKMDA